MKTAELFGFSNDSADVTEPAGVLDDAVMCGGSHRELSVAGAERAPVERPACVFLGTG